MFYVIQGNVERAVGTSTKARECYESGLASSKEVVERKTEVAGYIGLGEQLLAQSQYDRAIEYSRWCLYQVRSWEILQISPIR